MSKTGKCDICGKKDSPLVECGDHFHFACENCRGLITHKTILFPERLWCSYPDCHCDREFAGVCQYKATEGRARSEGTKP